MDPQIIKNYFQKDGIIPFNDNMVPIDRYNPMQYRRLCEINAQRDSAEMGTSMGAHPAPSAVPSLQHKIVDSVPSTCQSSPVVQKISFEELLLDHVKQAPWLTNKRKEDHLFQKMFVV